MKINYAQIPVHFKKPLPSLICISSNDAYLSQETLDAIRRRAREQGFVERIKIQASNDWDKTLHAELHNRSLFSDKRLIELHLDEHKPNAAQCKALLALLAVDFSDSLLVIHFSKIDTKLETTKWFKLLENKGLSITLWPIAHEHLGQWIMQKAQQLGLQLEKSAADFLAHQTEGNLLATAQEIEKLRILHVGEKISLTDIERITQDYASFDVFSLVQACFSGQTAKVLRILTNLQLEGAEPTLILWAITRELRLVADIVMGLQQNISLESLFRKHRLWQKRQLPLKNFIKTHPYKAILKFLKMAHKIDKIIKGLAPGKIWLTLQQFSIQLAGSDIINNHYFSDV